MGGKTIARLIPLDENEREVEVDKFVLVGAKDDGLIFITECDTNLLMQAEKVIQAQIIATIFEVWEKRRKEGG